MEGSLPAGMKFNSSNGTISGIPTEAGTFYVSVGPDVASTFTNHAGLRIDPIVPQTPALTVSKTVATGLPSDITLVSIASVNHGSGDVLYLLAFDINLEEKYTLWISSNGGANWNRYRGSDVPQPQSNGIYINQLSLAQNGNILDLIDAGGADSTDLPDGTVQNTFRSPRIFHFNGSSWSNTIQTLPFTITDYVTPKEYVHSDGSIWVAWGGRSGVEVWRSLDHGDTWTYTRPGRSTPLDGFDYQGGICLAGDRSSIRHLWNEYGSSNEFGAWDESSFQWQHSSWTGPQHDWPAARIHPWSCATLNGSAWAFGFGRKPGETSSHLMYMKLSDDQTHYLYPRRAREISSIELMTNTGSNAVYGIGMNGSEVEVWKLSQ